MKMHSAIIFNVDFVSYLLFICWKMQNAIMEEILRSFTVRYININILVYTNAICIVCVCVWIFIYFCVVFGVERWALNCVLVLNLMFMWWRILRFAGQSCFGINTTKCVCVREWVWKRTFNGRIFVCLMNYSIIVTNLM